MRRHRIILALLVFVLFLANSIFTAAQAPDRFVVLEAFMRST